MKLGRWLVRESRDELHSRFWKAVEGVDSRLAPKHVQRGWDAVLAEEEASREVWEPGEASLLSWGVDGATTEPPLGHASSTEVFEERAYSGHDPRDPDCEFDPWDEVALDYDARCPICSRAAETSVAASATDGPTGVEPSPQAPPVGPPPNESPKRLSCTGSSSCVCDLHMYMAESDAVVAQFNEAEDRRLRLAMDLQEAVTEHTEHIDGVTDWIDVAYELQSSYVITPRRKTS